VTSGNEIGLNMADYIRYLADDPDSRDARFIESITACRIRVPANMQGAMPAFCRRSRSARESKAARTGSLPLAAVSLMRLQKHRRGG
jgi:hypothetical protein